jgi:BirA family biotin operon repressor/biotin-[acetyl-CoA-carboxylase] ligase
MTAFDLERARLTLAGCRFERVTHVEVTGSTNADLLAAARRGEGEQVLVADHQTAGRGRLDHVWEDEAAGSLLVSVLIRPVDLRGREHRIGTAVGLAGCDAARSAGAAGVTLKWPNDLVVADGRKLAGVLLESVTGSGGIDAVVAGMGCNVAWAGPLPPEAVDLAGLGASTDRVALLVAFLESLERWLAAPDDEVHAAHRRSCSTLGQRVRVTSFGREVEGRAEDLTAEGALVVLDDAGQRQVITVGDVMSLRGTR